jgi:hypothetical protein
VGGLEPVHPDEITGPWKGGEFDTDHPSEGQFTRAGRYGKTFNSLTDVALGPLSEIPGPFSCAGRFRLSELPPLRYMYAMLCRSPGHRVHGGIACCQVATAPSALIGFSAEDLAWGSFASE